MQLNNEGGVQLPKDLQKRIKVARNSLTLAEQEYIRLNELKRKQEGEIKENLGKIKDSKEEIEDIKKQNKSIIKNNKELKITLQKNERKLKENIIKFNKVSKEITVKEKSLNIREVEVLGREMKADNQLQVNEKKGLELDKLIEESDLQVKKIKLFAESL